VKETVEHLRGSGDSPLEQTWSLIEATSEEHLTFCRLIGALGLSPYETHASIEKALDMASSILSDQQMMDMCLTSGAENIVKSAFAAGHLAKALSKASELDLSALRDCEPPMDQSGSPAWSIGYKAARRLRDHFSIAETDIAGASTVFDMLNIDPAVKQIDDFRGVDTPLLGGVEKHELSGRLMLTQEQRQGRRFAAARAAYFLWAEEKDQRRFITTAVTRDQQISRAFAAELLVPQSYVRAQAKGRKLSWERVHEIANLAGVAPELIRHQANNSGLQILAA
jgi:hypothetical protein